ncbi:Putative 8-oxo-dGTPase [Fulvivirga imtechensis AK7]|uniref:Putative 8-oxo-dGTPase n=1 Tax=Fulvivirga imtechensis AK7 TaxID=1237149 RepID=L8JNF8_9BACT|nr:NUDIX hydrolase [Fulvivirga imtechensis]ELR70486.1 Putative 8-oxo-dGTPase [Fulvivirga imtechensis AK7]
MAINQNILVTADAVVFGKENSKCGYLLLIERKNEPFQQCWAFPGGFVEDDEDLRLAAARELEEETGLKISEDKFRQVGAWGTPGRDPRGRTVTIVFTAEVDINDHQLQAADDASDVKWWPLDKLPKLAFDHQEILDAVLKTCY